MVIIYEGGGSIFIHLDVEVNRLNTNTYCILKTAEKITTRSHVAACVQSVSLGIDRIKVFWLHTHSQSNEEYPEM